MSPEVDKNMQGKLIVIEGLSGAGKSTTTKKIINILNERGVNCQYNHGACTQSDFGRSLKQYMKQNKIDFKRANEVAAHFVTDLVQNTVSHIQPLLRDGVTIVQDRYTDSIVSYHRLVSKLTGNNIDYGSIFDTYKNLGLIERPTITVLCTVKQQTLLDRLKARDEQGQASTIHQQYIQNPDMIDIHQGEFMDLINQTQDHFLVLNTDNWDGLDPLDELSERLGL
jgi:dTMP kinase